MKIRPGETSAVHLALSFFHWQASNQIFHLHGKQVFLKVLKFTQRRKHLLIMRDSLTNDQSIYQSINSQLGFFFLSISRLFSYYMLRPSRPPTLMSSSLPNVGILATGWKLSVTGWGSGMSASCTTESNCRLMWAMDDCIMHCSIISSCQPYATSEIGHQCVHWSSAIESIHTFTFLSH